MSNLNEAIILDTFSEVENKLLLLFLIKKIEMPLSHSQISKFVLEDNYMTFFTLQQVLAEMTQNNYLIKIQEMNNTMYEVSEEGFTLLDYFENHIPLEVRNKIIKYVEENKKFVKKEYDITSNYNYDLQTNEYITKCSLYDDDKMLIEISMSVVSKEQAKIITRNWKKNISTIYGTILTELTSENKNTSN